MGCSYCHDSCCQYGADVDGANVVPRVEAHADELERFTGVRRDRWCGGPEVEWTDDASSPAAGRRARASRTARASSAAARARGCMLHTFALERGIDYHELKPMVCSLFPVTFDGGLLHPSNEIEDRSLQCIDDGPTLYKGVRERDRVGTSARTSWPSSTGSSGGLPSRARGQRGLSAGLSGGLSGGLTGG